MKQHPPVQQHIPDFFKAIQNKQKYRASWIERKEVAKTFQLPSFFAQD